MGTQGALVVEPSGTAFASRDAVGWPHPIILAADRESMGGGASNPPGPRGGGMSRPRLPGSPGSVSDAPSMDLAAPAMQGGSPMPAPPRGGGMAPPPPPVAAQA